MELNAEQIKKDLEYCRSGKHCDECNYFYQSVDDICAPHLMADALALITFYEQRIKKLTEEILADIEVFLRRTCEKGYCGSISNLLAEFKNKYTEEVNDGTKLL